MALGALASISKDTKAAGEAIYIDEITLVGDSSYPTGGSTGLETLLQAALGDGREILSVTDVGLNAGYVMRYDRQNKKLLALKGNGVNPLQEEAGTTNLSGTTFKLLVTSR